MISGGCGDLGEVGKSPTAGAPQRSGFQRLPEGSQEAWATGRSRPNPFVLRHRPGGGEGRARGSGSAPPRRALAPPPARGRGTADHARPRRSLCPAPARGRGRGRYRPGPQLMNMRHSHGLQSFGLASEGRRGGLGGRGLAKKYIRRAQGAPPVTSRVRRLGSLCCAVFPPAPGTCPTQW